MILIQDDPIVQSIMDRGYPPWIHDDDDSFDSEDGDNDVFYGNETDSF